MGIFWIEFIILLTIEFFNRMRKIIYVFISLLAAFSATADNYFTIDGIVNDTLLINPSWIGTGRIVPVGAHFDGRVDQWTVTVTYPGNSTVTVTRVERGSDMDIPYITSDGSNGICHAPLTVSDSCRVIASIITEFGYWDRYNNGNYESYGTVKWEAGDYDEMFKIHLWINGDFTGDSITFDSSVYGTWDWRGGTTNGMFFNRIYLKVGYIKGDVNGDGVLNIADVTRLISIVLSNEAVDQYVVEAGDMTGDGVLTIGDVTALASYINNNTLEYIPDIEI